MDTNFPWAVNKIKIQMAIDRLTKQVTAGIIKTFGEDEIKAEYIKMAGLVITPEVVAEVKDRSRFNSFVKSSGQAEKLETKLEEVKKVEAKKTKKTE